MAVLAEQRRELAAEPTLRMGEWARGMPYATNRLQALGDFERSPLAATWRERVQPSRTHPHMTESAIPRETVSRHDCSGVRRRLSAMFLDLGIIDAILKSPIVEYVPIEGARNDFPGYTRPFIAHLPAVTLGFAAAFALLGFFCRVHPHDRLSRTRVVFGRRSA